MHHDKSTCDSPPTVSISIYHVLRGVGGLPRCHAGSLDGTVLTERGGGCLAVYHAAVTGHENPFVSGSEDLGARLATFISDCGS